MSVRCGMVKHFRVRSLIYTPISFSICFGWIVLTKKTCSLTLFAVARSGSLLNLLVLHTQPFLHMLMDSTHTSEFRVIAIHQ